MLTVAPAPDPAAPVPDAPPPVVQVPPGTRRIELGGKNLLGAGRPPLVRLGGVPLAPAQSEDDKLVVELRTTTSAARSRSNSATAKSLHYDVRVAHPENARIAGSRRRCRREAGAAGAADTARGRDALARAEPSSTTSWAPGARCRGSTAATSTPRSASAAASVRSASTTQPPRSGASAEQAQGWNDLEENLGLARTYTVELADDAAEQRVLDTLRSPPSVEAAAHETFALRRPSRTAPTPLAERAWEPHDRVHAREAQALEAGRRARDRRPRRHRVSLGHPELQRKLLAGDDTVDIGLDESPGGMRLIGDSRGDDFTPTDYVGHGTHVAGIVGATGWELPPRIAG